MGPVTVKIIGCGDAFGSGGQMNTCFYLQGSNVKILIDCGASSLPLLRKHEVSLTELDIIVLTHFHGDHFGGLPFILLYLSTYGQEKPLQILSPPHCRAKVKELLDILYPGTLILEKLNIDFITYEAYHPIISLGIRITAFPVIHTVVSFPHGIRIEIDERIISYSGDTSWTDELIPLSRDADLFICECCFYRKEVKGHLNYTAIEKNLSRFQCKKILLTHFDTEMLDNLSDIELDYAREGEIIDIL